jgi:hypothetical protein
VREPGKKHAVRCRKGRKRRLEKGPNQLQLNENMQPCKGNMVGKLLRGKWEEGELTERDTRK